MANIDMKCVVCGGEKSETVVRLLVKGVERVACAGCMPVIIHGAREKGHACGHDH